MSEDAKVVVLDRADPEREDAIERLTLDSGVTAEVERHGDGDVLRVEDAAGHLLLELQPGRSRLVLSLAAGDLVLRAAQGEVKIEGAKGVRLEGPQVTVETERLRQVVGVVETHARRILERAKDTYRDVEGLAQLRAGDVRHVASNTFRTLARHLRLRAKKTAKIDGEQIHLG
jgi:hypothetical protein